MGRAIRQFQSPRRRGKALGASAGLTQGPSAKSIVEGHSNTGTFTITRSGDTDDRYEIWVDFTMSGLAQRGVDYVLKQLYVDDEGNPYEVTKYGNSVDIPAGETSATVKVRRYDDPSDGAGASDTIYPVRVEFELSGEAVRGEAKAREGSGELEESAYVGRLKRPRLPLLRGARAL